ncbi:MAG TPA: hypothetical protein DEO82_02725 [Eubacterium sp.]|nr:hypothetical protein [Eubacterium sp.]
MQQFETKSIKNSANHIFVSDTFDSFNLIEASFATLITTHIDGKINKSFLETTEEYVSYKDIKPLLYNIIKGKTLPVSFKIIIGIKPELIEDIIGYDESVKLFILNIKYDNSKLYFTTAVSYDSFTMDKDQEKRYDNYIERFLCEHDII